jgi:prepilin-type N-terminal cleavage/methylation domain-containing protein
MGTKRQGYKMQDTGCRYLSCIVNRGSCIGSYRALCIMNQTGFTLIELMVTMVVFVLVMAAASQVFTGLLTQFKQQSKIAETDTEGIIGLEILRRDIEHAGYGLSWVIPAGINYEEASAAEAAVYNDAPNNPPRAIISGNNVTFGWPNAVFNDSDYLVIKATNVARNAPARRWTHLSTGDVKRIWDIANENFVNGDRVIVLSPGTSDANRRSLVVSGGGFHTTYNATDGFADDTETRFIYGINNPADDNPPRMPFNRADYYIWRSHIDPAQDDVPDRCAPNTGVLRKAVIAHADGSRRDILPLLDCVADMQIVYGIDIDTDGAVNCYVNDLEDVLATVDAKNIRDRVRAVRVYILAQEGQFDRDFTFNPPVASGSIRVGELSADLPGGSCTGETVLGRDFKLNGITNWQNYRWKVYTLVVKPNNLR